MKILQTLYSIWVMLVFIVLLFLSIPLLIIVPLLSDELELKIMHHYLKFFAWTWFTLIGIHTKFYNQELLHASGSAVIIPNHSSYLDAAIIYRTVGVVFKTLGKIEITKAPLFGLIYRVVVVAVDRSSIIAKAKSFLKMTSELEKGVDILVFPEGTFDEEKSDLKPFHSGAFKLALHAKKPLLPVLLVDAFDRLNPKSILSFSPGKCRVVYLPPIQVVGLPKNSEKALKDYAYQYMNEMLNYCRNNDCVNTLAVAHEWLLKNTIVQAKLA